MRFWEGWCGAKGWCDNPSGSRPNFFGRQHLTFDKGGKGGGAGRGIVRFWKGWTERRIARLLISISIIASVFTKCKIHSVSPYRSIHVLTASMPNIRSFRCYSRHLLYQSCKGAVYSSFQTQASVCRTAV